MTIGQSGGELVGVNLLATSVQGLIATYPAGPLLLEVERAAIGPTTLTGDIMVVGTVVSG